jgi:hypothetical protein
LPAFLTRYLRGDKPKSGADGGTRPLKVIDILVGTNTTGLESFRAQLLVLIGDHMNAKRKLINIGSLSPKVEDADLGIGDATIETGLGKRLQKTCW